MNLKEIDKQIQIAQDVRKEHATAAHEAKRRLEQLRKQRLVLASASLVGSFIEYPQDTIRGTRSRSLIYLREATNTKFVYIGTDVSFTITDVHVSCHYRKDVKVYFNPTNMCEEDWNYIDEEDFSLVCALVEEILGDAHELLSEQG